MRIAIDIRPLISPHKTGVGIVTECLIRHFAKRAPNDEFVLFATGSEDALMNLPLFKEPNIFVEPFQIPNKLASLLWLLPFGPTMERFLSKKPDVWLFPNAHLLRTQLPYIVFFHDAALRTVPECFTYKDHLRAKAANEERIFHHASRVIAVSEHSARDAAKYYHVPPGNITVASLGVDHDLYLPREQPNDRSFRAAYDLNLPYILCLATREPRKNIDSVIRAYNLYRSNHGVPLPLVIAGAKGWHMQHIDNALAASPYRTDIREVLYVPEKHKPALYRGAQCLVFPSFYEGFGLPVLEAMACGTPVITSISSALPSLVGNAALLVDPHNISDITQALHALLDEPDGPQLRMLLRNRGCEQAKRYSWEQTADIVLRELRNIVRSNLSPQIKTQP
jgi:glycosyltransferase involved in cell wall biosynthesis